LAQTYAEKVQELGHLGATFFFSVNGRTDHKTSWLHWLISYRPSFPNIATSSTRSLTMTRRSLLKTMSAQFDSLIIKAVPELESQGKNVSQKAISIDSLCEFAIYRRAGQNHPAHCSLCPRQNPRHSAGPLSSRIFYIGL
jgi:hypothetical protein